MLTKILQKKADFKNIKLPVKIRDSHRIDKEKHVDLLLIVAEGKRHYFLITYFNIFMYDHILHRGKKHFCCYCLQDLKQKKY